MACGAGIGVFLLIRVSFKVFNLLCYNHAIWVLDLVYDSPFYLYLYVLMILIDDINFLLQRTTILLQRSARQAPWPSPYLDAFGEEVYRFSGKPICCSSNFFSLYVDLHVHAQW